MTLQTRLIACLFIVLTTALADTAHARAESWCAQPLWVHEWGVQVFTGDGSAVVTPALPSFFYRPDQPAGPATATPVRALPADPGVRALPVMHFYSLGGLSAPIPLGLEVGFSKGAASYWFPAVDQVRSASDANSAQARVARERLELLRHAREVENARDKAAVNLPTDPTRQLIWNHLQLTRKATHTPAPGELPWVHKARAFDSLWVNNATESERFVFYEADTTERSALTLKRGETFAPGRRHYILENTSPHNVFDVFFVHREEAQLYVFFAPQIPSGKSAGFVIEAHGVKRVAAATTSKLRALLLDPSAPTPPKRSRRDSENCVMMRDPAVPVEEASSHRLYKAEIDTIMAVWSDRFFEQEGTTVLYREATEALDALMPLSLYTDMHHHIVLHRAGLALWEKVLLP